MVWPFDLACPSLSIVLHILMRQSQACGSMACIAGSKSLYGIIFWLINQRPNLERLHTPRLRGYPCTNGEGHRHPSASKYTPIVCELLDVGG